MQISRFAAAICSSIQSNSPDVSGIMTGCALSLRPFAPQMHVTKDIENTVGVQLAGGHAGVSPGDVEKMCHYVLEHGFPTKKPRQS